MVRSRRATASVTSFSSVPRAPRAPVLVAAVAGVDHDRAYAGRGNGDREGRQHRQASSSALEGRLPAVEQSRLPAAAARSRGARCSRRAARSWRDACRTSGRSRDGWRQGSPGCIACRNSCRGTAGGAKSSASASNVTIEAPGLERHARRGGRCRVEGDRGAGGTARPAPRRAARAGRRRSTGATGGEGRCASRGRVRARAAGSRAAPAIDCPAWSARR